MANQVTLASPMLQCKKTLLLLNCTLQHSLHNLPLTILQSDKVRLLKGFLAAGQKRHLLSSVCQHQLFNTEVIKDVPNMPYWRKWCPGKVQGNVQFCPGILASQVGKYEEKETKAKLWLHSIEYTQGYEWPAHFSNAAALVALEMGSARSKLLTWKQGFLRRRLVDHGNATGIGIGALVTYARQYYVTCGTGDLKVGYCQSSPLSGLCSC